VKDDSELLLQVKIVEGEAWSGDPPCLKVHFSQVKMYATFLEDTLQTVLGSRAVGPRHSPTNLAKLMLLGT
jgi:hypothetical protein